jgi:hypothetical protein
MPAALRLESLLRHQTIAGEIGNVGLVFAGSAIGRKQLFGVTGVARVIVSEVLRNRRAVRSGAIYGSKPPPSALAGHPMG